MSTRERPIIFSGPMATAILRGEKTQTRRVIDRVAGIGRVRQFIPTTTPGYDYIMRCQARGLWHDFRTAELLARCPYGAPGDRLWVRESFSSDWILHQLPPREWPHGVPVHYWADGNPEYGDWTPPKPPIHMPRWASRLTLEIVSVRVERLLNISNQDAEAEGVVWDGQFYLGSSHVVKGTPEVFVSRREAYRDIWDSINAKRGHGRDTNPWVWVVEFARVTS